MTLTLSQVGLLPILRLMATAVMAGWMSAPMSWSPDGEWLSYTETVDVDPGELTPGWLFAPSGPKSIATKAPVRGPRGGPAPLYRIWARQRQQHSSVLIEESHDPLTAPAWSPRGKSVAFGRFVPQSIEVTQATQKGRYEVVIQDGLDRKQVVWSTAEFELDPIARLGFSTLACSWSADGLYLAIPRPGAVPAIEIVRTDNKKRVLVLDRAILPAWSPDGARCAFVHVANGFNRLDYVERRGQGFDDPRPIASLGPIVAPPCWNSDSRSIFAVVEKTPVRSHELELVRLGLEPREFSRVIGLVPEATRKGARIRGLAIDFDREAERCFFAVDLEGRDSDVVWCQPRERASSIHKRFHPLDVSQPIMGVSISPDGQLVAMRFGSPQGLTPPLIYDSETEQATLVVTDHDARRTWLLELARACRQILSGCLPPPMVEGQLAERPTLLPLPGEIPRHENSLLRLNRLARFGSALCAVPAEELESARAPAAQPFEPEFRLFFDYLRGDYATAAVDLDKLEPLLVSPRERLALLSLRAQLFWARGERAQARAMIDYLIMCADPGRRLVEETPIGLVFSPAVTPDQVWAQYLSIMASQRPEPAVPSDTELPGDVFDPRFQPLGDAPAAPLNERAGGPIPFAPQAPDREIP